MIAPPANVRAGDHPVVAPLHLGLDIESGRPGCRIDRGDGPGAVIETGRLQAKLGHDVLGTEADRAREAV